MGEEPQSFIVVLRMSKRSAIEATSRPAARCVPTSSPTGTESPPRTKANGGRCSPPRALQLDRLDAIYNTRKPTTSFQAAQLHLGQSAAELDRRALASQQQAVQAGYRFWHRYPNTKLIDVSTSRRRTRPLVMNGIGGGASGLTGLSMRSSGRALCPMRF